MVILETLDHQKGQPERDRQQQPSHGRLLLTGLRGPHPERHRQAAADQDDRVETAEHDVELETAFRPGLRVPHAIQQIRHQQAAEEHHLGDKEDPHAERGRLVLLIQRLKVMLERRVMRVRVACRAEAGGGGVRIGVCRDTVRQL